LVLIKDLLAQDKNAIHALTYLSWIWSSAQLTAPAQADVVLTFVWQPDCSLSQSAWQYHPCLKRHNAEGRQGFVRSVEKQGYWLGQQRRGLYLGQLTLREGMYS